MIPSQGPLTSSRDGQGRIGPPWVPEKKRRMQALVWLRDSGVQVIRPRPKEECLPLGVPHWASLNVLGA